MRQVSRKLVFFFLISAWLVPASSLWAQSYWVNASNSHLVRLAPGSSTPEVINNDANKFNSFRGLAVLKIGATVSLVVANAGGEILCYEDVQNPLFDGFAGPPLASGIDAPEGPSVGIDKTIYFLSSPEGTSKSRKIYQIRFPDDGSACSDYGPAMEFASTGAEALADTEIVRFDAAQGGGVPQDVEPLAPGDLLVLWRKPAKVERFAGGVSSERSTFIPSSCAATRPDNCFPAGVQPTGMAFDQFGNLLVTTIEGDVYRFDRFGDRGGLDGDGNRIGDVFASGLEIPEPTAGKMKIAVGIVHRKNVALISSRNGGVIHIFEIGTDGRANALRQVFEEAESPSGIDCFGCDPRPTFGNQLAEIGSRVLDSLTFPVILQPGLTLATDFIESGSSVGFADPRESDPDCVGNGIGMDEPFLNPSKCQLFFDQQAGSVAVEQGEPTADIPTIPHYVRCQPVLGVATCFLVILDGTVQWDGVLMGVGKEDPGLPHPDCDLPGQRWLEARWLYAPDADDDPIFEESFTDITKCGSDEFRGSKRQFSFFFRGRSTQPLDGPRSVAESSAFLEDDGIVDTKLFVMDALFRALPGECASNSLRRKLDRSLARAIKFFDIGNYRKARSELHGFFVAAADLKCIDERVEFLARGESALDFLDKLIADSKR